MAANWILLTLPRMHFAFALRVLLLVLTSCSLATASARRTVSLDGKWLFQTNGAPPDQWKTVTLPCNWEAHEGTNFNGIGWYQRELDEIKLPAGTRALLHFQAVATDAEVFWNGTRLGSHLGGWTPFRFDVTEFLAAVRSTNQILVRVDEKVGHNTQGFLPIVQPHFGGIWQGVCLEFVPETYIDDLHLLSYGNPLSEKVELSFPLHGPDIAKLSAVEVRWREKGSLRWKEAVVTPTGTRQGETSAVIECQLSIPNARLWSPEQPTLYELQLRPQFTNSLVRPDLVFARAAFRDVRTNGTQLLLNGRPLNIRGLLNWGYYPPVLAPVPSEAQMRRDIQFARERGFNLMKFCLWIPPRRFLELADEAGMLTWMEYPTWHPQFTEKHLPALRQEFREFFNYDRNHPSVILRSLTCETGPSADLAVIQSLYDEAKRMIPGALVEDDSSWISWNRVSDFYDDHPYGNNHTWVATLKGLNDYVARNKPKPLVLGEAIAADTWPDFRALERAVGQERPYWLPAEFDHQFTWSRDLERSAGAGTLAQLRPDSLRYGMLMRKFQAEVFRREVPYGGYVISVIRDFPGASMGLIDYRNKSKWSANEWEWHGDTALLLQTSNDVRSAFSGQQFNAEVLISHFGPDAISGGRIELTLKQPGNRKAFWTHVAGREHGVPASAGSPLADREHGVPALAGSPLAHAATLALPMPVVDAPTPFLLRAELKSPRVRSANEWTLWVMPRPENTTTPVVLHASVPAEVARLFPESTRRWHAGETGALVIASRFDRALVELLETGGRVLMLPDGTRNSFPLRSHWFLRGAPFTGQKTIPAAVPRQFLLDLQHFDLAGRVIPSPEYWRDIDPLLMLWDTHDRNTVTAHGLVFAAAVSNSASATPVPGGRASPRAPTPGVLLVSALTHHTSPAGKWLLSEFIRHATEAEPSRTLPLETWSRLKHQIDADELKLSERDWLFRPDPNDVGVAEHWHAPDSATNGWSTIRVGKHWEGQGHRALDRWAWYRLTIKVPEPWRGRPLFLTFTGVDDMYELFIDGKFLSRRGDVETKQTTFSEIFSHDLSRVAHPGQELTIAVRVYDWVGAGGIFQPVYLGTSPHSSAGPILSR